MARKRKKHVEPELEADLIPVMNVMLLLIPALLLAMEVAQFAAIPVVPPMLSATAEKKQEDEEKKEKPLDLRVFVANDGYRISAADQQEGAGAGQETDSSAPTIPLKNSSAGVEDFSRYDYAALEAKAKEYKRLHPNELQVKIDAEQDIPFQVLATTMDALRGTDCKLKTVMQNEVDDNCLFWQPILDPRRGGG